MKSYVYFLGLFLIIILCFYYVNQYHFNLDEKLSYLRQKIVVQVKNKIQEPNVGHKEGLDIKIDYRNCSIEKPFHIFLYPLEESNHELAKNLYYEFQNSVYRIEEPEKACLYVYVVTKEVEYSKSLKYWNENGQNHLLIFVELPRKPVKTDEAMIVSSSFENLRPHKPYFDLSINLNVPKYSVDLWKTYPKLIDDNPRAYLFSLSTSKYDLSEHILQFLFDLNQTCDDSKNKCLIELNDKKDAATQGSLIENSTFVVLFSPPSDFPKRFYEVLKYGGIPIVIYREVSLPFDDLIDWKSAIIRLPLERLPDLPVILKRIPLVEVMEMKRKGRFYFENNLSNLKVIARSILSAYRYRLDMLSPTQKLIKAEVLHEIPNDASSSNDSHEQQEFLAPSRQTYASWNLDPTHLETDLATPLRPVSYPSGMDDLISSLKTARLPSDEKYHDFLGGSYPDEKYTIIMLAYKRDEQIKIAVSRMNGLKFLDRAIVVWNDISRAPPAIDWWPKLHVPLFIVNGTKNSLNNRFIPFDLIRTDAIFNMDDDFEVTNEYIGFMFRVWRQNRDVIVGPNFRLGYVKDEKGEYTGPDKCEYNMVLTSAAFVHKSYLYSYTYLMSEAIRQKVDELINCEDIAINFLVSHLTRKPPIKATPIRNSHGSKAGGGLSTRGSHYIKRGECIKFFTDVYGYNPLLSSQFRVDSLSYGFGEGSYCFKTTK